MNKKDMELLLKTFNNKFTGCILYSERGYGMSMYHVKLMAKLFVEGEINDRDENNIDKE